MKRFLYVITAIVLIQLSGCSESVPVNIGIGEIGEVEDVLSVEALTGDGKVHLSWELPSDAIGVSIRKSDTDFPFSVTSGEEIYAGDDLEFVDEDVEFEKRYYYLIVTIDKNLNFAGGKQISSSTLDYGRIVRKENNGLRGLKILSDGDYIYAAGRDYSNSITDNTIRIEKYTKTNPSFAIEFGTGGSFLTNPSSYPNDNISIINCNDNKILLFTCATYNTYSYYNLSTYNNLSGDLLTSILPFQTSFCYNLIEPIIDTDSIFTAESTNYTQNPVNFRLKKYFKNSGSPDTNFGDNGTVTLTRKIGTTDASVRSYNCSQTSDTEWIYLNITWSIRVSTPTDTLTIEDTIYKINKSTGIPDPTFGISGSIIIKSFSYLIPSGTVPLNYYSNTKYITINEDYIYYFNSTYFANILSNSIQKRDKNSGALSSDFNNGSTSVDSLCDAFKINNNYIYYYKNATTGPSSLKRIEKTTGAISELFITENPYGQFYIEGDAIYIQDGYKIKKINISDGSAIIEFGDSGILSLVYPSTSKITDTIKFDASNFYIPMDQNTAEDFTGNWCIEIRDKTTGQLITGPLVKME